MVSRFVVLFGFLVVWFLGSSVSWFLSFFVFLVSCSYVTCVFGPPATGTPNPQAQDANPKSPAQDSSQRSKASDLNQINSSLIYQ